MGYFCETSTIKRSVGSARVGFIISIVIGIYLQALLDGFNGATPTPRCFRMRHSAATSVDLPASAVVHWTIRAAAAIGGGERKGEKRGATIIALAPARRLA